jgi:hypothetical protein
MLEITETYNEQITDNKTFIIENTGEENKMV